ncbi:2S seed storage protein [Lactuca sativa]|uniref:Bifunctional inhibitor/plant lipid transfer protein/seed storage helical domain-containing protein n=1 Tax=Lactuca sativa TaxID=4236 RepID=A0A9R1URV7_LACSA|nr:2S seed storage protein [Lactuca sativa]KAJ0191813.1 hypothetical protein LSAT_V11C800415430 [Lactuca sativa]
MAKLIALAFTALVAFASAHNSNTIPEEGSSVSVSKQQCSQQLRGQRFNQCLSHVISTQQEGNWCCNLPICFICDKDGDQGQGLEQCCNELQKVEEECQCEAMKEVYSEALKQQQHWSQQPKQQGEGGRQPQTQDLQQIVQNLRNQCKLQAKQC